MNVTRPVVKVTQSPVISPGHWGFVLKMKPSSSTSVDRPPSLLPVPIDAQGQPLLSTESTSSRTGRVPIDGTARRRYLRFRKRDHQQSRAIASCTLLFSLALIILLPFSLSGTPTRLLLASLPIPPPPPLPSLPTLLASLHSLLLHLRQVAQCSVPCPFLTDIACHYVSL